MYIFPTHHLLAQDCLYPPTNNCIQPNAHPSFSPLSDRTISSLQITDTFLAFSISPSIPISSRRLHALTPHPTPCHRGGDCIDLIVLAPLTESCAGGFVAGGLAASVICMILVLIITGIVSGSSAVHHRLCYRSTTGWRRIQVRISQHLHPTDLHAKEQAVYIVRDTS